MNNNYVEIKIRDSHSDQVIDKRSVKNRGNWFELLEKYGNDFLKLEIDDLMELFNIDISEVEEYVRRKNK